MPKLFKQIITIIGIISFAIVLILFSLKITLAAKNLTPEQSEVVKFLQGRSSLSTAYNQAEASHLQDVKMLLKKLNYWFYLSLLILSASLAINFRQQKNFKLLSRASLFSIISLVALLLLLGLNFSFVFRLFHYLFFPQGNWLFPENSLMIQTFPGEFFVTAGWQIIGLAIIISLIIFVITKRIYQKALIE